MEKEKDLIGKLEVCELLGISKRNLERWVVMGLIPYIRIEGEVKFSERQVLSWISSPDLIPKNIENFSDLLLVKKMQKQKFEVGQMNQYLNLRKILNLLDKVESDEWSYREVVVEDSENKNPERMGYKEKYQEFLKAKLELDSLSVDDPGFNSKFTAGRAELEKWKLILSESDPVADQIESEKPKEVKRVYFKDELQSVIEETFKGEK